MSLCVVLQQIPSAYFTECLRELAFILFKLLATYHQVLRYHIDENERLASVNYGKRLFVYFK